MGPGSRVRVRAFSSPPALPAGCAPAGDWQHLIGCAGVVVQDPFTCCKYDMCSDERRVLVRFDCDGIGANRADGVSLWVQVIDLEVLP